MASSRGPADDGREMVQPRDAADWHRWLDRNGAISDPIWLVMRRKPGPKDLTYEQAVEEALCFGWIDSTIKTMDAEHNRQFFARRKTTSTWSRSNKERVEKLVAEGRMTPAGQAPIDAAKSNGMWTAMDAVEDLEVPEDLAKAFARNREARDAFENFSDSVKKSTLWWIVSAKRPETRAKRISVTVRLAAEGIRITDPEARKR